MPEDKSRALFFSAGCAVLSASFLADFFFPQTLFSFWQQLLFWPALAACVLLLWKSARPRFKPSLYSLWLFLAVLTAGYLRLYKLAALPLNHDEARTTLQSLLLLWNKDYTAYAGLPLAFFDGKTPALFTQFLALSSGLADQPEIIVRMPAVICGLITVWLVYFLAKEMNGRAAGIAAAVFLALNPWHILYSRVGVSVILGGFFAVSFFLLFIKAVKKKDYRYLYTSFFILSVGCFWSYTGTQVLFLAALLSVILLRRELSWVKGAGAAGCIIFFLLPLYPFLARWQEAGFTGSQYYHVLSAQNFFPGVLLRLGEALQLLFWRKQQFFLFGHGLNGPIIQPFLLLPLALGAAAAAKDRISARVLGVWFLAGLFFSVVFVNEVADRYFFIISPAIAVALALGVSRAGRKKTTSIALACAILGSVLNLAGYFVYVNKAPLASLKAYSFGSREISEYLLRQDEFVSGKVKAAIEWRMSPAQYYFIFSKKPDLSPAQKLTFTAKFIPCVNMPEPAQAGFYCLWSLDRENDWDTFGCRLYKQFRLLYPDKAPVKIIYYPDGAKAVEIFKLP